MKFKVDQKDFYRGINTVQRSVAKKKTLPILTGIHISADKEEGLHLTATDLELGIENWVEADVKEEGTIVLPGKQLRGIVRELPQETINVEVDLENYQAELNCLTSEFNINGFNPEEFPQLPEVNVPAKFTIDAEILSNIIEEVKFSTSSDETQPALTGALMIVEEDNLKMVSTNTYRLAYSEIELSEEIKNEEKIEVILPGNTLDELSHLLEEGEVKILVNSNYISFHFSDIMVVSRLIEGKFPNYNQVIPDQYETRLTVDRKSLQQSVKRTSLIARLNSNVLTFEIADDRIIINSVDSESGHAHEEVEAEIEGTEQNINIDADYMMDVLKILNDEEIIMELNGKVNPMVIKKTSADNYIYLIMPVRSG